MEPPIEKKHIEKIDKVQRAVTKWVPSLRDLSYEDRLKKLQLRTLAERRDKGDMVMLHKCVEGIEKIDISEYVIPSQSSLRGHSKNYARKFSFPDRTVAKWNALPKQVVCVKNIHSFKEKYDELMSQDGTKRA